MARLKTSEMRQLGPDELKEKFEGAKKELFSLRLQAKFGKLEKHSSIRKAKRDVARILTLIKEKETK